MTKKKFKKKKVDIWGIIAYILGLLAIAITVGAILYMALK